MKVSLNKCSLALFFYMLFISFAASEEKSLKNLIPEWVDSWDPVEMLAVLSNGSQMKFISSHQGQEIFKVIILDRKNNISIVSEALREKYRDGKTGVHRKLMIAYALAYFLYGHEEVMGSNYEALAYNLRLMYLNVKVPQVPPSPPKAARGQIGIGNR